MGLFSAPMRGLLRVFEEVAAQAEQELYNEDGVKQALTEIYGQLEAGLLSEEEFAEQEAELVERLEQIARHRRGRAP